MFRNRLERNFLQYSSLWEADSSSFSLNKVKEIYRNSRFIIVYTNVSWGTIINPVYISSVLLLTTHRRIHLPHGFIPSVFTIKIRYAFFLTINSTFRLYSTHSTFLLTTHSFSFQHIPHFSSIQHIPRSSPIPFFSIWNPYLNMFVHFTPLDKHPDFLCRTERPVIASYSSTPHNYSLN